MTAKQIRMVITFTEEEREAVRAAFAAYLASGGKMTTQNTFCKEKIMEGIRHA